MHPSARILTVLLMLFAVVFGPLAAQEPPLESLPETAPGENPAALPRSFRSIDLGMSLEELRSALAQDGLFRYRGDQAWGLEVDLDTAGLSLLPFAGNLSQVEAIGISFIDRAFFQLNEGQVYIMAFSLNTRLVDHYSVYTSLVEKYGEPDTINPREAVWERGGMRLSLERPLTVKYIDTDVFGRLLDAAKVEEAQEFQRREEFLNAF